MILKKIVIVGSVSLLLNACGGSEPTDPELSGDVKLKSPLEETLQSQLDALEKAQVVEEQLLKHHEERDKKMRDSGI